MKIIFTVRNKSKLLRWIRSRIRFTLVSNVISIDKSITDNVIRTIMGYQELDGGLSHGNYQNCYDNFGKALHPEDLIKNSLT